MAQNLDQDWVKEIFTPNELKQYMEFEKELKGNATPEEKAFFESSWDQLLDETKNHLSSDPYSKIGIHIGRQWMNWVNGMYGKKYAHLRTKIFEQGFVEGKGLEEVGLTPEIVSWSEKAIDAYWRDRISEILAQIGKKPSATVRERIFRADLKQCKSDKKPLVYSQFDRNFKHVQNINKCLSVR